MLQSIKGSRLLRRSLILPFLILIFTFSACGGSGGSGGGGSGSGGGSESPLGSEENPFLVYDETDLANVGSGNDGWDRWDKFHYKQMNDIDLSTVTNWTPISPEGFYGSYDGNGKTISNLKIDRPSEDKQGLFGLVGGTIKNVTLLNVDIKGQDYVGGIVGSSYTTIQNCSVNGNVTGRNETGGIVGSFTGYDGLIQGCYFTGTVTGNYVGGIAGYADQSPKIQNCYVSANVSGNGVADVAGGIVGYARGSDSIIEYCYVMGNVSASNFSAGGVVGQNYASIRHCVALNNSVTTVSNADIARRIIGGNIQGTFSNNYGSTGMTITYDNGANNHSPVSNADYVDGLDVDPGTSSTQYGNQGFWTGIGGWDFNTVWEWDSTNNRPILQNVKGQ